VTALPLSREVQRALVAEAARAPTVHNVQPARWRFLPDGGVVLYRAVDRTLPIADPTGHDVRVSLGAAWEGMSIALSRHGLGLSEPEFSGDVREEDGRIAVASARLIEGASLDPLAEHVEARRSYRGRFLPLPDDVLRRLVTIGGDDVRWIADGARMADLARRYDEAAYSFVRQPAYHAELYRWMRLSPRHPDWARDGLNAECMALSGVERAAASVLLRPRVFGLLKRLGAARAVISEAAQVRSASAVLLFTPTKETTDFAVGRLFYRLWLEVTALGAAMVPMSALADSPPERDRLCREHGVPDSRRLANVFRVGAMPPGGAARSPRLPVDEILV
jgi:nitroreductase